MPDLPFIGDIRAELDDPAVEIVRLLDTLDSAFAGGHAEMRFNGVTVGPEAVLGEVAEPIDEHVDHRLRFVLIGDGYDAEQRLPRRTRDRIPRRAMHGLEHGDDAVDGPYREHCEARDRHERQQ